MKPGDIVTVSYTGYTVEAKVLEVDPVGRYGPQRGWLMVEQITDYEDRPEGDRPTYEAAVEFCVPSGQTPVPGPFSPAWFAGNGLAIPNEN